MKNRFYLTIIYLIIVCFGNNLLFAKEAKVINDLAVSISDLRNESGSIYVKLTIMNRAATKACVDKLNFPVDGILWRNLFSIQKKNSSEENDLMYLGKLINRGRNLKDSDYLMFKPKASRSVDIRLSDFYKFDQKSKYIVTYNSSNIKYGDNIEYQELISNTLKLALNSKH